jgi:hypothetical protein
MLMGLVVAGALVVVNSHGSTRRARPQTFGWVHGYPFRFIARQSLTYRKANTVSVVTPVSTSSWFDGQNVTDFRPWALTADIASWLALVSLACGKIEVYVKRNALSLRFSLGRLLAATAWTASVVAVVAESGGFWREVLRTASAIAVLTALALAWLAAFDLVGILWNAVSGRGRSSRGSDA